MAQSRQGSCHAPPSAIQHGRLTLVMTLQPSPYPKLYRITWICTAQVVAHPACNAAMLQELQPQVGKTRRQLRPFSAVSRACLTSERSVPRYLKSPAAALLQQTRPNAVNSSGVD